ncbi:MAG TPA: enterochelin esterase [Blastocatellia bacterium]|nr:enterochelin esterase [Blastocatellia bacterium]
MLRHCSLALAITILSLTIATTRPASTTYAKNNAVATEEKFDSPRLAALAKEIKAGNRDAIEAFWRELKDKAPLVEPVVGDEKRLWVTYVWRGDGDVKRVDVMGGAPAGADFWKPLARLMDTNIWYRTERLPNDARFTYTFVINFDKPEPGDKGAMMKIVSQTRRDPFNPRAFPSPPNSTIVELPAAPPQPWIKPLPGASPGEVKFHKIKSEILKEDRAIRVYTPPGYDPKGKPCGLLIFFDGETVPLIIPLPTTLDNLIARDKIPPMVAVMVNSQATRSRDLACSGQFADFLAKELVTWARANFNISADPKQTVVSGFSLGGLAAAYSGLRYPEVFGNVLSQSGSFWYFDGWNESADLLAGNVFMDSGWLTRQFAKFPRLPLRFFMEVGTLEQGIPVNMVLENRRLHDVLVAKGYPVTYSEYNGGHDMLCWRGSLADGLIALVGKRQENQP